MRDLHLHISAIDSLMFRDGRPFNQNDAGASVAASVFPPYPPTIVGAVRAALWQGPLKGEWDTEKLGDGTNWQNGATLGKLKFGAPLLLKNGQPVFPVPLHILAGTSKANGKSNGEKSYTRLVPSKKQQTCDLGKIYLPIPKTDLEGVKTIEDRWVTRDGMKKILDGGIPENEHFIDKSEVWRTEPRVGIGIDSDTRITSDNQLYMASHVRMADDVSLYVDLHGWDGDILGKSLRPLAGEHRMAEIGTGAEIKLPTANLNGAAQFCLIALSPVIPDKDGIIAGLGDVITACLGKPISIGGWDSQAKTPIPLRQCYPAGSVWFINGNPPASISIGQATEWGFGQMLIGKV